MRFQEKKKSDNYLSKLRQNSDLTFISFRFPKRVRERESARLKETVGKKNVIERDSGESKWMKERE